MGSQASIARRHRTICTDPVVGAILSGWRYDISATPAELRVDYESHLESCAYCRGRQRLHRTVDILLFAATTLSFAAFLLMALVMRRIQTLSRLSAVRVHLPGGTDLLHLHLPASITVSLQAIAIAGVVVSMLLWVLVAVATPIPGMVSDLRERMFPRFRERAWKQAA